MGISCVEINMQYPRCVPAPLPHKEEAVGRALFSQEAAPLLVLRSSSCLLNLEVEWVAHFTSSEKNLVNLGIS